MTESKALHNKRLILGILFLVVICFFPSLNNEFVNWDDPSYLHLNPTIRSVSFENVKQVFGTYVNSNYQPLTLVTFMFEFHFVKLSPFLYHFNNIFLHVINTFLVYCFVYLLTRNKTTSLLVMLLFGIHPMRVESIAWVTERKDVLFAFFYLCGLIQYIKSITMEHGQKPFRSQKHYWFAFMCFVLAVFSKPTAVSFPIVLLFIDYYLQKKWTFRLLYQKFPFFLVSFIFGIIAVVGTTTPVVDVYPLHKAFYNYVNQIDLMQYADSLSLMDRCMLVSYMLLNYVLKIFWFVDLSCLYPYPDKVEGMFPLPYVLAPLIFLILMIVLLTRFRTNKNVVFGTLFFLATVFFNLPLRPVGHESFLADRFTYLPYLGLFLIFASTVNYMLSWKQVEKWKLVLVLIPFFIFMAYCTFQQNKVWKDSGTLWTHVLKLHPRADVAYYNRGNYYFDHGQTEKAIKDYNGAIIFNSRHYEAFVNRGLCHERLKKYHLALMDYSSAVKLNSMKMKALYHRWYLNFKLKNDQASQRDFQTMLKQWPQDEKLLKIKEKVGKYYDK